MKLKGAIVKGNTTRKAINSRVQELEAIIDGYVDGDKKVARKELKALLKGVSSSSSSFSVVSGGACSPR